MTRKQKLVIVESPTKAKTISGFLGKEFKIESSYGHVRDLPRGKIGVDVENNFEPRYVIPTKIRRHVNQLKRDGKEAEEIILATDEDREGESIAWHITKALDLTDSKNKENSKPAKRIVFHEITENAIKKALKTPRDIDMDLVNAQQARRVLDRLVGYKLSPFLWKKVANRLSAGRVQSVALKFLVDRENEIRAFVSDKYWTVKALFEKFSAELNKIDNKTIKKPGIMNGGIVKDAVNNLKNKLFEVKSINKREVKRNPQPPFITSALQREASRRFYFSAKQTMRLAQNLYEKGLITYMRTDSLNLSEQSLEEARSWIKKELGNNYLLKSARRFKTKSRTAQEAHEAIRPTKPSIQAKDLKKLEKKESKLYDLIWKRFMASQMPPAVFTRTTVDMKSETNSHKYTFRVNGNEMKFDGFMKVFPQKFEEKIIPQIEEGEKKTPKDIISEEHETTPPPRYNEAGLIKKLEENGIGRPSTYAPTLSVIQARNYVEKDENRRFKPTEIGELVNKVLTEHFPKIVDVNFTAKMEEDLDKIANGEKEWHHVIEGFYHPFEKNLEEKYNEVKRENLVGEEKETNETCDKCGKKMVIKTSRFGRFLGCSGFPECKNTEKLEGEEKTFGKCPKCEKGGVVKRRTKKGGVFYGCSRYPDCDHASWKMPKKNSGS